MNEQYLWTLDEYWGPLAVDGNDWSLPLNNIWGEGLTYTIRARATDTLNNQSSLERTFIYADIKNPTTISCVLDTNATTLGGPVNISGDIDIVGSVMNEF